MKLKSGREIVEEFSIYSEKDQELEEKKTI